MRRRNKGGALVSARLCRLPEQEVHQPSSMAFICLVGALPAWLVHLKGVHLSQVHQPSSMAFICLVGVLIAWLVYLLLGWCTSCLVGVLLAWLVHLRQVHPLKLHLRKSTVCVRHPIGFRSPSNRIASAARSDSVRRPIGLRPPPNRIPFAARSDCVRCPMI